MAEKKKKTTEINIAKPNTNRIILGENYLHRGHTHNEGLSAEEIARRNAEIRAKQQENLTAAQKRKIAKIRKRRLNNQ